jgi:hypothetical protein
VCNTHIALVVDVIAQRVRQQWKGAPVPECWNQGDVRTVVDSVDAIDTVVAAHLGCISRAFCRTRYDIWVVHGFVVASKAQGTLLHSSIHQVLGGSQCDALANGHSCIVCHQQPQWSSCDGGQAVGLLWEAAHRGESCRAGARGGERAQSGTELYVNGMMLDARLQQ